MLNLKEIEDTLTEWEDEAEEAVKGDPGIKRIKELVQSIDDYIQAHHGKEIEKLIRQLTEEQGGIGSDHDELTPDSQIKEDTHRHEYIEEILDKLRKYNG